VLVDYVAFLRVVRGTTQCNDYRSCYQRFAVISRSTEDVTSDVRQQTLAPVN
jgi:hypothetical protein